MFLRGCPMAEYRTLLIRAISRLDANTLTARESVYARARAALAALLEPQDHSRTTDEAYERERRGLDEAIAEVEASMANRTTKPTNVSTASDGYTHIRNDLPDRPETALHTEFLDEIKDDLACCGSVQPKPESCVEDLAVIVSVVSQE
jgi:hypothetical protein